jgi:hypothetical protein
MDESIHWFTTTTATTAPSAAIINFIIIIIISDGLLFPGTSPLEPVGHPTTQASSSTL